MNNEERYKMALEAIVAVMNGASSQGVTSAGFSRAEIARQALGRNEKQTQPHS